jgi:hypothetical protein
MIYLPFLCAAALIFMAACTVPSKRFDQLASEYGFLKQEWKGDSFTHTVYSNTSSHNSSELHVYLGGDGTPWIDGRVIAWDPTPRNPVGLRLMALDDIPSIYLGRPCYHGHSGSPPCSPTLWTYERYSRIVIDSMITVLHSIVDQGQYKKLVLIGFSGGGGFAMFLANEFPQTRQLVTLAGNLDIEAWVQLHQYDKLYGSLNPRTMPPLPERIQQYHFAAGKDDNVPPWMIEEAVSKQSNSQFIRFEEFTHGCCWEKIWQQVLKCLDSACAWSDQDYH